MRPSRGYKCFVKLSVTRGRVSVFVCVDDPDCVPNVSQLVFLAEKDEEPWLGFGEISVREEQEMQEDAGDQAT